ncbi:hypothetical protein [Allorhizobium terrae]|uniref:TonB C-terminal domain-containing protein n=1 Tax=Allorhizobium terrae TaxID=1848972 RepID=A0A4S3ZU93_9HYPH|nr:hypothetical protein [Allorhizobium terrae]THF49337.1 hypothetical protein E6C51_13280 [Allorhizobium terrae]
MAELNGIGREHVIQKRRTFIDMIVMILTILGVCAFSISTARAASIDSRLGDTILSCFSPPPGATHNAQVSVTFAADGSFAEKPKIIESGQDAIDTAFANAALRALLRCESRIVQFRLKGTIVFNFPPSGLPIQADVSGNSTA